MPPKYTISVALEKLRKYCTYQERSHKEVKDKLWEWKFYSPDSDEILARLIAENFLNEERFARAYTRGKFRMKGWGRRKILKGLMHHSISPAILKLAMEEIEAEAYSTSLQQLLDKKRNSLEEENSFILKNKLARYAIGRGYEQEIVWEKLNGLVQ